MPPLSGRTSCALHPWGFPSWVGQCYGGNDNRYRSRGRVEEFGQWNLWSQTILKEHTFWVTVVYWNPTKMIVLIGELWNDSAICLSLEWVGLPGYNFAGCSCCLRISFIFEDISISSLCRPGTWSRKTLAVWVQSFCWGFEHLDWNLEGKPTHRSHKYKEQIHFQAKHQTTLSQVLIERVYLYVDWW